MFIRFRLLGILFFPLVVLYTLFIYVRNKLYDWGWLKACPVSAPVISVGNIQIGGTGKTPFVEYLSHKVVEMGKQPAILTRGYRRRGRSALLIEQKNRQQLTAESVGDEPLLLSRNLPNAIVGVDSDRCGMAERVLEKYPDSLLIMDDGFQHRRMKRNLDIVLIDISRWSRLPLLFPLTYFRDVKSSLKRTHLVILTRTEGFSVRSELLMKKLSARFEIPLQKGKIEAQFLQRINEDETLPPEWIGGKKVAAFCGIANPEQFFWMLKDLQANILWQRSFPDHHYYTADIISEIKQMALQHRADLIVTTQKDAVKIEDKLPEHADKFYYLKLGVKLDHDQQLNRMIQNVWKEKSD